MWVPEGVRGRRGQSAPPHAGEARKESGARSAVRIGGGRGGRRIVRGVGAAVKVARSAKAAAQKTLSTNWACREALSERVASP